ncbi:poly [ADP-ribose] polymerase tankyrase-like isoform X2 [Ornithodoros turicata]|uniref:poly [ADP-ribose] polymerase tankyrase-like isoform X2 n=1 Tax=Ornithodoros turicata TaxID=34597 RepID=UPI003139C8DF
MAAVEAQTNGCSDEEHTPSPVKANHTPATEKKGGPGGGTERTKGAAAATPDSAPPATTRATRASTWTPPSGARTPGQRGSGRKRGAAGASESPSPSPSSSSSPQSNADSGRASKRLRLQYQPFQSPPSMHPPIMRSGRSAPPQDDKLVLFQKGEFLAVRNENGSFYVCRTAQNVYKSSRRFKIQWMNNDSEQDIYAPDFYDNTDFECVLTNLRMRRVDRGRYLLPDEEHKRTLNILQRALSVENGMAIPDPRQLTMDGVDVSFVGQEEEEAAEAAAGHSSPDSSMEEVPKPRGRPKGSRKASSSASSGRGSAPKPNPKVTLLEKETFFESETEVPSISSVVQSKLLIRAVLLADHAQLKSLLKDNTCTVWAARSPNLKLTALDYAVLREDHGAMRLLLRDWTQAGHPPANALLREELEYSCGLVGGLTGAVSGSTVHDAAKMVAQSGVGNGPLLADAELYLGIVPEEVAEQQRTLELALRHGVSHDTLDLLLQCRRESKIQARDDVDIAVVALRCGHRHLAGAMLSRDDARKYGYTTLHKDVLLNTTEPLGQFDSSAVLHKAHNGVTPIHCSSINPRPAYLAHLLAAVVGNVALEVRDDDGCSPTHYAAACDGSAPLELLLSRGSKPTACDNRGFTALHSAADAGRHENIELLLKRMPKGSADLVDRRGRTALHLAACRGALEVVRSLLREGADVECAAKGKVTALMLAAEHGHLEVVRALADAGATLDARDESNCTALLRAIANSQTHVCSLLLRLGADPDAADSAGNTAVHYAAAYGWIFCLRALVEGGAALHRPNKRQLTPVWAALLKGHLGIAEFLLDQPSNVKVDVDAPDLEGRTLVMRTVRAGTDASVLSRLQFLLEKHDAHAARQDSHGNNALHHLVMVDAEFWERNKDEVAQRADASFEKLWQERSKLLEQATSLLVSSGCSTDACNRDLETPLDLALRRGALGMLGPLLTQGVVPTDETSWGAILHALVRLSRHQDVGPVLDALCGKRKQESTGEEPVQKETPPLAKEAVEALDASGRTPLLAAMASVACTRSVKVAKQTLAFVRRLVEEHKADTSVTSNKETALHLAAQAPSEEAVELVLTWHPQVDAVDAAGCTALGRALIAANHGTVQALLAAGASANLPLFDRGLALKPLVYVTMKGLSGDFVRLLLKHKASPACSHPTTGDTPLHYVAGRQLQHPDSLDTARALLDAGADANAANAAGRTPLHSAAEAHSTAPSGCATASVEELLVQRGSKPEAHDVQGRVPLHYAFVGQEDADGDPVEVVPVLSPGAEVQDELGRTPLHWAALCGAPGCTLQLAQKMRSTDVRDADGNTPLGLALLRGHLSCCLVLLQQGASATSELQPISGEKSPEQTAHWQWRHVQSSTKPTATTVLQEAIRRGWPSVLQLMLDQLEATGKTVNLALEAALKTASYELALRLIGRVKHGWTLYSDKQTMLHLLAREASSGVQPDLQLRVAQALVDKGVPVMARDEHGCSVLTYAAINWNHTLCQFFSDKMGMVASACTDPDRSLRTPFSAIFWRLGEASLPQPIQEWCLSLVAAGASADLLTCYPLRNLEFPGTVCLSEDDRLHVEGATAARLSPLILAVCKRNYAVVKMLLRAGVNPNFSDGQQRTALMYAVKLNDMRMAKMLLNGGYDPDRDTDPYGDGKRTGFKKTSAVDLTHRDIYGWTAVHHAVAPLPDCTYWWPGMLQLLAHAGAPLDTPDLNGVTPLQLAAARGVESLSLALQALLRLPRDQLPKVAVHGLPLAEDSLPPAPQPAFREDCRTVLSALPEPAAVLPVPDEWAGKEPWEVVAQDDGPPYDVLLTAVDPDATALYSFYKMQVLRRKDNGLVMLFTRWGRVGDRGQYRRSPFASTQEASREFCRLFRSKTGNTWQDGAHSLKCQPKKFRPVQLSRPQTRKPPLLPAPPDGPASSLPPQLQALLHSLVDDEMLRKAALSRGAREEVWPGSLSGEALATAQALLEDVHQLVLEKSSLKGTRLCELLMRIVEKSEGYYHLVGVHGHRGELLEPLFEVRDVNDQLSLLHHLSHLQTAGELVVAAYNQKSSQAMHPLDYVYRSLPCHIQALPTHTPEAQTLLQYIHNSASQVRAPKVKTIFRVSREGEAQRLSSCELPNHWLLWHGLGAADLLGVFASGLRPRPAGQGIALADRFEAARAHCISEQGQDSSKYMLLCQVALGQTKEVEGDREGGCPAPGCESVKFLGRWQPHPLGTVSWHSCNVPLGPTDEAEPRPGRRPFHRYVVHKADQVCIRYLVQFED